MHPYYYYASDQEKGLLLETNFLFHSTYLLLDVAEVLMQLCNYRTGWLSKSTSGIPSTDVKKSILNKTVDVVMTHARFHYMPRLHVKAIPKSQLSHTLKL